MDRELFVLLLGFLFGELILILLLAWIYRQLQRSGTLHPEANRNRRILILFWLLPLMLAAFIVPGILARLQAQRATLPVTGAPGFTTPTATAPATDIIGGLPPTAPLVTAVPTELIIVPVASTPGAATQADAPQEPATPTSQNSPDPPQAAPTSQVVAPPASQSPVVTEAPAVTSTLAPSPTQPAAPTHQVSPTTFVDMLEATAAALQTSGPTEAPAPTPAATTAAGGLPSSQPWGKIVFVCQVFKDTERDQLCLINADGTGEERLTTNDNADYNFPSVSPNGASIVYTSNESGSFQLYEMDLTSREVTQLTQDQEGEHVAPEISPNGKLIVYTRRVSGHNSVWVMNRDGSEPHQVFGDADTEGWDPVWSPDGTFIQFASNINSSTQLFQMLPDGAEVRQVSNIEGIRGRNDWSPDGLLLSTYVGEPWQREIYIMGPDGSNPRAITEGGNNLAPSFSPDGRWITFVSYRDHLDDEDGCEIYIMRVDGSDARRLTDNDYCDWQPRWGP